MEHAKDQAMEGGSFDCLEAFHDSIHEYATVGDSILAFQDDFGYKFCEYCGTGIDKIMQCTACKTVSYCSSDCQKTDWATGGHKAECAAICGEHPWSQYAKELVEAPLPSSVTARHYLRFAALVESDQQQSIEKIEGRHGGGGGAVRGGGFGGFRGGGSGALSVRPLGIVGGRGGGGGGGFLSGFRRAPVPVYTRPYRPYGSILGGGGGGGGGLLRWGGRGFGGHRYGFWPGWRFPWVHRHGLWFPWWFYINPVYYETGMPYVDPTTGISYGVPPAAPGMWGGGEVVAPPNGQGYAQPPLASPALMYADIRGEIVSCQDLSEAWSLVQGETADGGGGGLLKRGFDKLQSRLSGKDKFERLMVARTKLMLHLAMSSESGRVSTLNSLKKNAYEWGHHLEGVYGSVTRILRNNSRDQRTASDMLIDLLDMLADSYAATLEQSNRSETGRNISQSNFTSGAGAWADFWTVMTIDPAEIPIYLTPESTLRDALRVFRGFAPANRAVFLDDMNKYLACLIVHAKGHSTERHTACLEMAAELGKHIDERYNKAVGIKEELVAAQAEQVTQRWEQYKKDHPEDAFALIEANKDRKQEGKNLAGEKDSKRGPILYKKLTPKQRTVWGKWDQAKQGREIAETELRTFMSVGGRGDPDQMRSIRNRIDVNRKLEQRYKQQVDALIGPGRLVISVQIGKEQQQQWEEEEAAVEQIGGEDAKDGDSSSIDANAPIGSIFTKGKRRPTDEQVQARRDLELAQDELFEAERALQENKGSPIPKNEKALKNHAAAAKKRVENAQAKAKAANKRAKAAAKAPASGPTRVINQEMIGEEEEEEEGEAIGDDMPIDAKFFDRFRRGAAAAPPQQTSNFQKANMRNGLQARLQMIQNALRQPGLTQASAQSLQAQYAATMQQLQQIGEEQQQETTTAGHFETIEGFMDHFRGDPHTAAREAAQRDIDNEYAQLQRAKWELQRDPSSQRMQQSVAYMEQQLYAAQQRLAQIGSAVLIVGGELLLDMQHESPLMEIEGQARAAKGKAPREVEGKSIVAAASGRGPIMYKKLTGAQKMAWSNHDMAERAVKRLSEDLREVQRNKQKGIAEGHEVRAAESFLRDAKAEEASTRRKMDLLLGPGREIIHSEIPDDNNNNE